MQRESIVHAAESPSRWMLERLLIHNVVLNPTCVVVWRSVLERVGGFSDLRQWEDWDTWLRIAKIAPLGFIAEVLANVRRHTGGLSPQDGYEHLALDEAIFERHVGAVGSAWKRRVLRRRARSVSYFHVARLVGDHDRGAARRFSMRALLLDPTILTRRKVGSVVRTHLPRGTAAFAVRARVQGGRSMTVPATTEAAVPDLERSATRGIAYAGMRFALERGMVFVATLVLARLLTPDEFGVVAFSLAVMNYFDAVTDLGLGAALVYRTDAREQRIASTAFWIGMIGATALSVLLWFLAPLFASIGPGQETVWLLRVLSLQFPLSALGQVHEYRIRASLDFKKLVRPFTVSTFAKGAVAVIAAALGAGVWSLVIGQLVGTLIRSVVLWRVEPWRPRAMFSRSESPSLLKFGAGIVAVEILGQIAKSFDYLVIGAKIGATALGFYFLAFRLPELVVLGMFQVANEVLFPFYARLREAATGMSDDLRDGYVRTVRLAAAIALPAGLGMAALAVPLVLVLYGPEWRASAAPLAFVAIWSALASLATLPGVVFKATGRSWLLTMTGVVQIAILLPAIWIAADHGIAAVAAAQVVEKTVSLGILGVFVGRVLRIPWYTTFTAAAPLLLPSVAMAGLVYGLGLVLDPLAALAIAIPVGACFYAALLRLFAPDLFRIVVTPALRAAWSRIRPVSPPASELTGGGARP